MWEKIKKYLIIVELQKDLEMVKKMYVDGKISRSELDSLESTIYESILNYIK